MTTRGRLVGGARAATRDGRTLTVETPGFAPTGRKEM